MLDGFMVFSAVGPNGREIYRMSLDGDETVQLVADVNPGPDGSYPDNFIITDDAFYFTARPATGEGRQLFSLPAELVPTEDELIAEISPTVFPNPTGDYINVVTPDEQLLDGYDVFTADGRKITSATSLRATSTQIDLTNFPAGNYWLLTRYENGESSRQLVQKF